jgi:transcriptional regulator with XRE-family HTH domain
LTAEVRFVREIFDLSQRDLAKALNVAPATAARWELAPEGGGSAPTGLHAEVLRGLHSVALRVRRDPARRQLVSGMVVLGVGALISYLLLEEVAGAAR